MLTSSRAPAGSHRDSVPASAVAAGLARQLGASVTAVTVLHEGSNVSVRLDPVGVVAKVGLRRQAIRPTSAWFERAVAIARYLEPTLVPAVIPAAVLPPGPHWHQGKLISYWQPMPVTARPIPPEVAGASLRNCHQVMAGYAPAGAPYDPYTECRRVLAATPAGHFLAGEREQLEAWADPLFDAASRWGGPVQPLHGDSTPRNLLGTADGHVWCDFEDTHVGAVWWDLACLVAIAEIAGDSEYRERATAGYGVPSRHPALETFLAARVLHSAIWSAYVNSPGPSPRRLRRLVWLRNRVPR